MLYSVMELEVSLPASHPFLHCRTHREWDWIELLVGLHVCVPTGGQTKIFAFFQGSTQQYFPSREVVLGLTSAVPTTPNVYFNISSYVTDQEKGNIFLSEKKKKKAQD